MSDETRCLIKTIKVTADGIAVHWQDGHISQFNWIWLRHQCDCELCGSTFNAVRAIRIHHIPEDIVQIASNFDLPQSCLETKLITNDVTKILLVKSYPRNTWMIQLQGNARRVVYKMHYIRLPCASAPCLIHKRQLTELLVDWPSSHHPFCLELSIFAAG